jgi:hypothetical protein
MRSHALLVAAALIGLAGCSQQTQDAAEATASSAAHDAANNASEAAEVGAQKAAVAASQGAQAISTAANEAADSLKRGAENARAKADRDKLVESPTPTATPQ